MTKNVIQVAHIHLSSNEKKDELINYHLKVRFTIRSQTAAYTKKKSRSSSGGGGLNKRLRRGVD